MEFLIANWYIGIAIISVLFILGVTVYVFFKQPSSKQLEKIKQWLIFACLEAERNFKSGTGALKLRFTYDIFIVRFPWLARVVSFEMFSMMVDEALVTVREMLQNNKAIHDLVTGEARQEGTK